MLSMMKSCFDTDFELTKLPFIHCFYYLIKLNANIIVLNISKFQV